MVVVPPSAGFTGSACSASTRNFDSNVGESKLAPQPPRPAESSPMATSAATVPAPRTITVFTAQQTK